MDRGIVVESHPTVGVAVVGLGHKVPGRFQESFMYVSNCRSMKKFHEYIGFLED